MQRRNDSKSLEVCTDKHYRRDTEREVVVGERDGAAAERCGLIEIILTSSSNLFRGNTLQIHK